MYAGSYIRTYMSKGIVIDVVLPLTTDLDIMLTSGSIEVSVKT